MEFGTVPLAAVEGALLAHSVNCAGRRMAKKQTLTAADLALLAAGGVGQVTVARPAPGDVGEAAAARLAATLVPDPAAAGLAIVPAHGGRVNLKAMWPGLLDFDSEAIDAPTASIRRSRWRCCRPWHGSRRGCWPAPSRSSPMRCPVPI